jgi:hypothetical protein
MNASEVEEYDTTCFWAKVGPKMMDYVDIFNV